MMVRSAALVLLIFLSLTSSGQRVPSSCQASDSIVEGYRKDAMRLSLQEFLRQGSSYQDSIHIPETVWLPKLDALIAVYNAHSIPEADTVGLLLGIHQYPIYDLNTLYIRSDTNSFWMQNLRNGIFPSGYTKFDSLLAIYGFSFEKYFIFLTSHSVYFKTELDLNISPFAAEIDLLPDLECSSVWYFENGDWISDSVYTDHTELTYSHIWGSISIHRRYWKFNVYDDCSVEFIESYGSILPPNGLKKLDTDEWTVFPNPFNTTLEIGNVYEPCAYTLYAVDGRLLKEGSLEGSQVTDLEFLPKGLYFLHLQVQDASRVFRIHKE